MVKKLVKTGPQSKLEIVEDEILRLLMKTNGVIKNGLGFREIHRSLKEIPLERRPGSFSTLQKCLKNLEAKRYVIRDPDTGKYRAWMGSLASLDKITVKKTLDGANVFGGGRLSHPQVRIVDGGFLIPKGGIKPFGIADVFMVVDLKGKAEFTDEGLLFIEVPDEYESKKLRENLPPSTKEDESGLSMKTILPVYRGILYEKLKPSSLLNRWLQDIFEYARNERLIGEDFFNGELEIDKISDEALDRIWNRLFSGVTSILLTELLHPQRLLKWLKTPEGKIRLKEAFRRPKNEDISK